MERIGVAISIVVVKLIEAVLALPAISMTLALRVLTPWLSTLVMMSTKPLVIFVLVKVVAVPKAVVPL